jgi:hypothetical protein
MGGGGRTGQRRRQLSTPMNDDRISSAAGCERDGLYMGEMTKEWGIWKREMEMVTRGSRFLLARVIFFL